MQANTPRRALVLGGGGYAASAWEIGLVKGMADEGLDIRNADLFVGTSAGARVGLYLASGVDLEELFQRQLGPNPRPAGEPPHVDWLRLRPKLAKAKESGGDATAILTRLGALALEFADTTDEAISSRRAVVAAQLPVQQWPENRLIIPAVNANTGERRGFDQGSGIDLVDAVVAATAFFGYVPALFEGGYYIDGGFYSSENADLAAGYDRVLVLALQRNPSALSHVPVEASVEILRGSGAKVEVIHPDQRSAKAFTSAGSATSPAVCGPSARAGQAQGRRLVKERALSLWQ